VNLLTLKKMSLKRDVFLTKRRHFILYGVVDVTKTNESRRNCYRTGGCARSIVQIERFIYNPSLLHTACPKIIYHFRVMHLPFEIDRHYRDDFFFAISFLEPRPIVGPLNPLNPTEIILVKVPPHYP
jgi:hypothetical protein